MGFLSRVSDLRNEQILRKAGPFLTEGEEVIDWVRAEDPNDHRHGILFLTPQRALIHWSGKDDHGDIPWEEVTTWGLNQDRRGGPVLAIETKTTLHYVQLAIRTEEMARTAREFIRDFAELAPWPKEAPHAEDAIYEPKAETEIIRSKRTTAELFRRWGLTVLGATLIIVGILIIPLPGPWSFILNIGGLAVLAKEHDWAEDLLDWTKDRFEAAKKKMTERKNKRKQRSEV